MGVRASVCARRRLSQKDVFVTFEGKEAKISFASDTPSSQLKFHITHAIGYTGSYDIVLKSDEGVIYPLSNAAKIPSNNESQPYKVQFVCGSEDDLKQMKKDYFEISKVSKEQAKDSPSYIKLAGHSVEKSFPIKVQLKDFREIELDDSEKERLKTAQFDVWKYTLEELPSIIEFILTDVGIIDYLGVNKTAIRKWLLAIKGFYREEIPFHNFRHAFSVVQMTYVFYNMFELKNMLTRPEMCALFVAGLCHDVDHPGLNNHYHVNAKTDLALLYNDVSPLENHHSYITFMLLKQPDLNIFQSISHEDFIRIRKLIIQLILATDMTYHAEFIKKLQEKVEAKSFEPQKDAEDKLLLLQILIKSADISNELRPHIIASPWLDLLLEEFFFQGDLEKKNGLPISPLSDRNQVSKAKSQVGFISFVLLPFYTTVGRVIPSVKEHFLPRLYSALKLYKEMEETEKEKAA